MKFKCKNSLAHRMGSFWSLNCQFWLGLIRSRPSSWQLYFVCNINPTYMLLPAVHAAPAAFSRSLSGQHPMPWLCFIRNFRPTFSVLLPDRRELEVCNAHTIGPSASARTLFSGKGDRLVLLFLLGCACPSAHLVLRVVARIPGAAAPIQLYYLLHFFLGQ